MCAANGNPENVGRIVPEEEIPRPIVSVFGGKLSGISSRETAVSNYVMVNMYCIYYRTGNDGKCNEIEWCRTKD